MEGARGKWVGRGGCGEARSYRALSGLVHGELAFSLLINLFLVALGLPCCAWAFPSCGQRGLAALRCGPRAPHCRGFFCCRAQSPERLGFRSCGTQGLIAAACGIFLDQGSNVCPLRQQADSRPVCHQGSLAFHFFRVMGNRCRAPDGEGTHLALGRLQLLCGEMACRGQE